MEILRHFAFVRSLPLLRQKHVQLGPSAVPEDRSFCKSERFILCALSGSGQIRPTDHQAQIFVADTVPLSGLQAVGCQHLHSCTACWCRYRESWSVTVADKGSVVKRYHEVLAKSDLLVALYIIGGGSSKSSGFGHIRPWMSEPNSVQIHPADGPKCWTDWSQTSWLLRITWINWTISNGWHSWIFKMELFKTRPHCMAAYWLWLPTGQRADVACRGLTSKCTTLDWGRRGQGWYKDCRLLVKKHFQCLFVKTFLILLVSWRRRWSLMKYLSS